MTESRQGVRQDPLTVAFLAVFAYMLGNLLHEGAGHGAACVLTGAKAVAISSVSFECSAEGRLVSAGGTLANLIAGAIFFLLGRLTSREYPRWKYFLWIAMTINLFTGTGYFLFSGIGGIGDWAAFIQGLGPAWAWRTGLTVFGGVTYPLAAYLSLRELRPLIGTDKVERYRLALRLTAIPYFCGGILMCIAGALNPTGPMLILISAAASTFGGTSGLLWATNWLKRGEMIPFGPPTEPLPLERSWTLNAAAGVAAVVFVVVLGRGIHFAA